MEDIRKLFEEIIAEFMDSGLDAGLDEEPGYSRYGYKNRDTGNSRNGHGSKTPRQLRGGRRICPPWPRRRALIRRS